VHSDLQWLAPMAGGKAMATDSLQGHWPLATDSLLLRPRCMVYAWSMHGLPGAQGERYWWAQGAACSMQRAACGVKVKVKVAGAGEGGR
jgi:hypothetical protein